MRAKDLIEAETPKEAMKHFGSRGFVPHRLTPDEQERIANILAYGPVTRRRSDQKFIDWGWIETYEGDETAVEAKTGFAARFYSHPEIKGATHPDFTDMPNWRGNRKTYHWREAEDPKKFLKRAGQGQPTSLTGHHTAEVESSGGTFTIHSRTGEVLRWSPEVEDDADYTGYRNIVRFNLDEWREHYHWPEGTLPNGYDVLDLGFWLRDGTYEPPDDDWRHVHESLWAHGSPGTADGSVSKAVNLGGAIPPAPTTQKS